MQKKEEINKLCDLYHKINQQSVAGKIAEHKRQEFAVIEILTLLILIQKYLSESNPVDK